jgi:hypothetical protein
MSPEIVFELMRSVRREVRVVLSFRRKIMQGNKTPSIDRQRKNSLLAALCLAMIGFFILMGFVARGRGPQGVREMKLSVEDPRPVRQAILKLEEKYGWVITYEDPRYIHDSEVADITLKVRRDLDMYKPGEAPKVFGPRWGTLEFTYDVMSDTNLPADPAMVVQKLLDAQAARDNGGRFRLETSGRIMHVIPTAIKNSAGNLVHQESVLDTIISLPAGERTVLQKLYSICAAISRGANRSVLPGTIPSGLFQHYQDHQGASRQRARDVLVKTFETMDNDMKLSWRLLYDPTDKGYFLNIHFVSKRDG